MTQTTLWYLNDKDKDFEAMNKRLAQGSFFSNSDNYPNFALEAKVSNQKLPISNNDVQFNIYEYSFDGPTGTRITGTLIMFQMQKRIGFIVDKAGYPNALSFLREICGYSGEKKTIVCEQYDPSIRNGSMFLWIISKIYHNESSIEYDSGSNTGNIVLNSLDGVKGNIQMGLNSVSTQGSDVINTLTTLAFLLESKSLTEVGLNISFRTHDSIQLNIHTHSKLISLDVEPDKYFGALSNNKDLFPNGGIDLFTLRGAILLIVHLGLIPLLYSLYKSESDGAKIRDDLVSDISDDITQRIMELKKTTDLDV